MYWTDWGRRPYIKHATMDGFNPKAIVDTNLGWPNGLTVDMNTSRIYWADARLDRYLKIYLLMKSIAVIAYTGQS